MDIVLSFVIPCYRSEKTIEKVINEIIDIVSMRSGYDYEIIAVNDSSPDNVYNVLEKLARCNKKIKVINLVKNMGKHSAMLAGYSIVKGDYIINLDDDMQCPVTEMWKLIDKLEADECDCVVAEYYEKKESNFKIIGSNINLWLSGLILDKDKNIRFENFSALKRIIADEIVKYHQPFPYFEGLVFRVTKRVVTVKMSQRERGDECGSGFTLKKSIALVLNGLTAFSIKPLQVSSCVGIIFSILGFVYGGYTIINKLLNPDIPIGYSSILSVILFSSGLIMLMLGIIGEYLGRVYICMNDTPQYVIRNTINV